MSIDSAIKEIQALEDWNDTVRYYLTVSREPLSVSVRIDIVKKNNARMWRREDLKDYVRDPRNTDNALAFDTFAEASGYAISLAQLFLALISIEGKYP
jgi:hypothetical protein